MEVHTARIWQMWNVSPVMLRVTWPDCLLQTSSGLQPNPAEVWGPHAHVLGTVDLSTCALLMGRGCLTLPPVLKHIAPMKDITNRT